MKAFHSGTGDVLREHHAAADKFETQGRALAAAAEQIDASNRRTER